MNRINLKYIAIASFVLSILIILGAVLFNLIRSSTNPPQPVDKQISAPSAPAVQSPAVSSFSAVVKEVKDGKLLIETQDDKPQIIEIPLDKNVTFEAWVYKDGKNKPPTRQSATPSDLKTGQKLDIFKTEVRDRQPIYEITILN